MIHDDENNDDSIVYIDENNDDDDEIEAEPNENNNISQKIRKEVNDMMSDKPMFVS